MMTPCSLAFVVAMSTALPLACTSGLPRQGWRLVWHDEFPGLALDAAKWVRETGGDGWGNAELEYYADTPDNARVANGHLVIEARREQVGGDVWTAHGHENVLFRDASEEHRP